MRINFPNGSFMLSWQKTRAWYNADGTLKDCEYKRTYRGHPSAAAIPAKHVHVLEWLAKQGAQEVRLMQRMGKA